MNQFLGETQPRFRLNADQSSDDRWKFNGTVEYKDYHIEISTNPEDASITAKEPLALSLLSMIKEGEELWRNDGRKLVSDPLDMIPQPPKSWSKPRKLNFYEAKINESENQTEAMKANLESLRTTAWSPLPFFLYFTPLISTLPTVNEMKFWIWTLNLRWRHRWVGNQSSWREFFVVPTAQLALVQQDFRHDF